MRWGTSIALAALALTFLAPGAAGEIIEDRIAKFKLFTRCEPMLLAVELLSPRAKEIGLTRDSIHKSAESRLRSSGLYTEDFPSRSFLGIKVDVVGDAFSVNLNFGKEVVEPWSQQFGFASTWNIGGVGMYVGDANYILWSVSQYIDAFLVEFLRVNEEACAKR